LIAKRQMNYFVVKIKIITKQYEKDFKFF
jgi:hypothetical protein